MPPISYAFRRAYRREGNPPISGRFPPDFGLFVEWCSDFVPTKLELPGGCWQLVRDIQRDSKGTIEFVDLCGRQSSDEISQHRLREADEFVAMDTAVVLQPFRNPHCHLSRQSLVNRVHRCAGDGREAGVNQDLTADDHEDTKPLRILSRWMCNPVQFAASHRIT